MARGLYNWFPVSQRGTAQGAVWMSARFMGGLTPAHLAVPRRSGVARPSLATGFWIFGGVGPAVVPGVRLWFRNTPEEHPAINQAERDLIASGRGAEPIHGGVPWGKIFRSRNLWYVCGMYVCINYGWYFFMYFLPDFLKKQFASQTGTLGERVVMALLAGGPLLVGVLGCVLGGMLTDRHVRRTGDRKWGRRLYGVIGFTGAAACYGVAILGAVNKNMWVFAAGVAMSGFFNDLTMGAVVGGVPGHRPPVLGHRLRLHEHDRQPRRRRDTHRHLADHEVNRHRYERMSAKGLQERTVADRRIRAGEIEGYIINLSLYALAYAIGVLFWLKIDASKPIIAEDELPRESGDATNTSGRKPTLISHQLGPRRGEEADSVSSSRNLPQVDYCLGKVEKSGHFRPRRMSGKLTLPCMTGGKSDGRGCLDLSPSLRFQCPAGW